MALRAAGWLSRSFASAARVSLNRSSPAARRLGPPTSPAAARRFTSSPRNWGELGCAQSLLLMRTGTCLTSHLTVDMRAYCELSHGIGMGLIGRMEKMGDALGLTTNQKAEE